MATVSSKDYREFIEEKEKEYLSPYAALSVNTRGRERPMKPCPIRTDYIRDRDRIIHCKSFRRLKHKTQVFLSPVGDHYRTRLTHTLEVSQIARTIARGLRLNEDLTEAIALGHDLGHTPFGHAGEEVLNNLMKDEGGFAHNEQSIRVVEKLENEGWNTQPPPQRHPLHTGGLRGKPCGQDSVYKPRHRRRHKGRGAVPKGHTGKLQ